MKFVIKALTPIICIIAVISFVRHINGAGMLHLQELRQIFEIYLTEPLTEDMKECLKQIQQRQEILQNKPKLELGNSGSFVYDIGKYITELITYTSSIGDLTLWKVKYIINYCIAWVAQFIGFITTLLGIKLHA